MDDHKAFLMRNMGWSEEQAEKFLRDTVVYKKLSAEGWLMRRLLEALSELAVPIGAVEVTFVVPQSAMNEFDRVASKISAMEGVTLIHDSINEQKLN